MKVHLLRSAFAAALITLCLAGTSRAAENGQSIVLPQDGDTFSQLVARAQAGDASVDFAALRLAWIESGERKRALRTDLKPFKADIRAGVEQNDPAAVAAAARRLLSVDYIDLDGHKYLRQACELLKDQACAERHHFVEFGLLNSITHSGDGKTCGTGWQAVSIDEEYFVLRMAGFQRDRQALIKGPPICDLLEATDKDGNHRSFYFKIDSFILHELD